MGEIKLGDTIWVDGHEYVVMQFNYAHDPTGRSVTVHAKDPFVAEMVRQQQEAQRLHDETLRGISRVMPKMEKALDE